MTPPNGDRGVIVSPRRAVAQAESCCCCSNGGGYLAAMGGATDSAPARCLRALRPGYRTARAQSVRPARRCETHAGWCHARRAVPWDREDAVQFAFKGNLLQHDDILGEDREWIG